MHRPILGDKIRRDLLLPSAVSAHSTAAAVLWTALDQGVRALPLPAPAGLCELPLARLSRYEPKPDPATGRLADEEWLHVHRVRALSGQWFAVRIAGDAALGLPRAGDWPVLMAVVRLFDEAGWASNTLTDVSIRRLLATMGVTGGGKMIRRVRDALLRFAQVRVLLAPMAASADPADALAGLLDAADADGAVPAPALWAPAALDRTAGRGRPRGPQRGPTSRPAPAEGADAAPTGRGTATGVLDVTWRGDTLDRITLADVWRPRAGTTATTWIDYERYFGLADPVAQRLYQLYAGAAARGEPIPFEHDLDWLRSALGLSARFKRSRVLEYLAGAAAELRAAAVLGDVLVEPPGRAAERVVAMPGPVLEGARLFAGLSLEVPRDARVQLAALQALGVHRAEAERLQRADPAQVYEVLCYVLYARRHEPEAIRDPGAYVRRAVAEGYRFAKPGYQAWRAGVQRRSLDLVRARAERPGAAAAAPAEPATIAVPIPDPVPSPVASADATSAPAERDAATLWTGVAEEVRRRVGPRELRLLWVTTQLHRVTGARLDGGALVCAVPDLELRAWAASEAGRALLGDAVGALTAGAVTRVVARLPGDVERSVDDEG
ncbi:hypothetical protein tb265_06170 [Gemmatimonadetes bacterium T265]|nr:hypothetical protein tb265_06170 [Gemmatimonadetes bacterium T265]